MKPDKSLWCSCACHEEGVSVARNVGKENLFLMLLWVRKGVPGHVCCSRVCLAHSCLEPVAEPGPFQANLSEIISYSPSVAWSFNYFFFNCNFIPHRSSVTLVACSCHHPVISVWLWEVTVKHWLFTIILFRYSVLYFRPVSSKVSAKSDKNKYNSK